MKPNPECRVCLGPCHRTIHAATLRLHQWWRTRLLLAMEPVAAGKERPPGARSIEQRPVTGYWKTE